MTKKEFITALDQLRLVLFTNEFSTENVLFVNKCKDLYVQGKLSASEVRSNLAAHILLAFYYVSRVGRESLMKDDFLRVDDMLDVLARMRFLL